jgi:peptidoglycan/LPS O-acetylase OafA/YrhL
MSVAPPTVELPLVRARARAHADTARLPALDALRAVGAIAVVACHVGFNTGATGQGYWGGLLARLDSGVAIFFSLSGFLLFRPFALAAATGRGRPGVGRYLWKRALRILPAYWAAVAAYLLLVPQSQPITGQRWAEHLTLTQIYGLGTPADGFWHTWSLCTEVAFYIVLPIVAFTVLLGRWRPVRIVVILTGFGAAITLTWLILISQGVVNNSPQGLWLPSYAAWFAAGMSLATVHVAISTGTGPRAFRLLDELASAPIACTIIAFGALAVSNTPLAGPRDLNPPTPGQFGAKLGLYTIAAVMLLIPLAFGSRDRFTRVFSSRPARWLGTVSYGLFLWHPFVIALIYRPGGQAVFTGDLMGTFALVLCGGLALAAVSYYALELPCQKLAARARGGRHRPS